MTEIKLFDYQEDMKVRIEKALCLHRSVMAQMPTGTGKTVLLASVVEAFLREHPDSSVWIVAHQRELVSQIRETIERVLSSKITPSLFTIKEGTLPTTPSLLHKEGSTFSPSPSSSGSGNVAGSAIAPPEFWSRQRSLCPQGAGDDSLTQQSCDCLSASASNVSPDCLCGVNRLAEENVPIQVLVNVDIFSEGFDCPDVEFVQLARPTLSLAKYLQMVGRGLRIAKGKKNCVIIDNVGLYRVFGLPSQVWNWKAMFEGWMSKKNIKETVNASIAQNAAVIPEKDGKAKHDVDSEMVLVVSHEQLPQTFEQLIEDEEVVRKREKLLSGGMGKVDFVGRQLVRLTEAEDKRRAFVDLVNMNYIAWTYDDRNIPRVVIVGGVEFVKYHGCLHSRTKFELTFHDAPGCIEDMGFYSRYLYHYTYHMCRVLENDISHCGGHCAIFLHNDPLEYYWLSGELHDGSLIVMSGDHHYYWAEKGKPKEYIGCAKSYEEERKMKERLAEIIKITNLRIGEKKNVTEENVKSLEPCQIGSKWGLRDGNKRIVIPPIYRTIRKEYGFFVFEQLVHHWGLMDSQGKVMIQPKYDKVKVTAEGMAILSDVTGKTQTINLG